MVWKKSTKLGFGIAKFDMQGREAWLTIYHYALAGNMRLMGDENRYFHENVKLLK